MKFSESLKYDKDGLIPVVVQDYGNEQVLMVAYMNREAVDRTLETGKATYWSRSRQEFWVKGATSGHFQYVNEVLVDCDADTLLLRVEQVGAACHTGTHSCFYRALNEEGELTEIAEPVAVPGAGR
jgi:phosphoribosyl-AMP cyclohydrolase